METNRWPYKALYTKVQGKRKPGRQKKKWIDNVKEDLAMKEISMAEAVSMSTDRTAWKHFLASYCR